MKAARLACVVVFFVAAAARVTAAPCSFCLPPPIAIDVVTFDTLAHSFTNGVTTSPLPGFDSGYQVQRVTSEIGSGGLYYVEYVIAPPFPVPTPTPRFSMVYFRPSGGASEGSNVWRFPLSTRRRGSAVRPATKLPNLAIRAIEHCLIGAHRSSENLEYDFNGTLSRLEFATYLPPWIPGLQPGDAAIPRRVEIGYVAINERRYDLVLYHRPLVPPGLQSIPSIVTLSRDAVVFDCFYTGTLSNAVVRTNAWPEPRELPASVLVQLWVTRLRKGEFDFEFGSHDYYYKTTVIGFNKVALPAAPPLFVPHTPDIEAMPMPVSMHRETDSFVARRTAAVGRSLAPAKLRPFRRGDVELEWLGRAGVDLARYVLSRQREAFDSLNQAWAGGGAGTNGTIADLLREFPLNGGTVTVQITDLARKANINAAGPEIIRNALVINDIHPDMMEVAVDSVLDWIDEDGTARTAGAENGYYQTLSPAYESRNGGLIEIAELGYVRGFSRELVHGGASVAAPLQDLFTTAPVHAININTASAAVLQLLPNVDGSLAQDIIRTRSGPDGVDGNEDDAPFRSLADIASVPGITPAVVQGIALYGDVRSTTFEVTATAKFGRVSRTYLAWVRRESPTQIRVIKMREL